MTHIEHPVARHHNTHFLGVFRHLPIPENSHSTSMTKFHAMVMGLAQMNTYPIRVLW